MLIKLPPRYQIPTVPLTQKRKKEKEAFIFIHSSLSSGLMISILCLCAWYSSHPSSSQLLRRLIRPGRGRGRQRRVG